MDCFVYKPPSGREVDFAKQKTEGARDKHCDLELTGNKESYTHSPSVAFGASSLPEGALGTNAFCTDFYLQFDHLHSLH